MDTHIQSNKNLPKIKLSLFSVNFLQQEDSKTLLKYVEELYQNAHEQKIQHQKTNSTLESYQNKIKNLSVTNQFLKEELDRTKKQIKALTTPPSNPNTELLEEKKKNNQKQLLLSKLVMEVKELKSKQLLQLSKTQEQQKSAELLNQKRQEHLDKFKKKVRTIFQVYAEKNRNQLKQLKHVQTSAAEIQKLINLAQSNNQKLSQNNQQLTQDKKNNNQTITQQEKQITNLKTEHKDYLEQQKISKLKTLQVLKSFEKKMQLIQKENKQALQEKNNYIQTLKTPLKESQKQIILLTKENSELNIQNKIQNQLTLKLRQYQDSQEKLEQQNQSLQKLNKNISLSLNQCRHQIQQLKSAPQQKVQLIAGLETSNPKKTDNNTKGSITSVLAKLYSSYSK